MSSDLGQRPAPASPVKPSALGALLDERDAQADDRAAALLVAMARKNKRRGRVALWLAVAWVAGIAVVAILADLLPLKPYDRIVDGISARTGPRLSLDEPLGTDSIGRSMLSRLIYGARQSLTVGILAVVIAMSFGTMLGLVGGYLRGKTDEAISLLLNSILSVPALTLLLLVAAVGKRDTTTLVVGISIVGIPLYARLARAHTLTLANREFVTAARALGAGRLRIMFRELLPSVIFPVSTFAFLFLALVILTEGTLSFLGLGIPPPAPSWGGMITDGRRYLATDAFLVFVPAFCLVMTVISFNVIGDHLRRRFDHRGSALQ